MKRVLIFLILAVLIALPSLAQIDCVQYDPCTTGYWNCLRDNINWNDMYVPGANDTYNPLNYDNGPGDKIWPAQTPLLKQVGNLLYSNDGFEKIEFLRGVGEYNEVRVESEFGTRYNDMFNLLSAQGINLVRIFIYSGDSQA